MCAELLFGEERRLTLFAADTGEWFFDTPRAGLTLLDYPVIADVDDDGSADLLVISSSRGNDQALPALTVLSDLQKRWMPARRIFNQDAYSVTNVNEDGTIPSPPIASWLLTNTFRAQASVGADGSVCVPQRGSADP